MGTYMIFAKDSSVNGPSLSSTEQEVTVTVTDGVTANIENMPLSTADTGSQYWFVGCLELVGESFNLQTVSEFSRESPELSNKLYCDSLFKQSNLGTTQPPFCPNTDMSVKVRNGLTNDLVPGAKVSVIRVEEDEEVIITEGAEVNADGMTAALVNQNGHYIVKVEAEGFIAAEREIAVDCVLTECDRCKPGAFVPLSPVMERGALRFSLSWGEKPMDLDLYSYRRNWRDWDQNCETYYMKKTGCNVAPWTWTTPEEATTGRRPSLSTTWTSAGQRLHDLRQQLRGQQARGVQALRSSRDHHGRHRQPQPRPPPGESRGRELVAGRLPQVHWRLLRVHHPRRLLQRQAQPGGL